MAKAKRICSIDGCNKPHIARGLCWAHYSRAQRHGDPLGGRTPEGEPLRFIHEVALAFEGDECLIWPFGRDGSGRGKIYVEGKMCWAHRVVCRLTHGKPPTPEHEAAHSCGKGHLGCVNSKHLSWKTPAENQADRLIHGTHSRGERNSVAKLSSADVERIRSLRGRLSRREIGRQFGISPSHVTKIHTGKSWVWLQ